VVTPPSVRRDRHPALGLEQLALEVVAPDVAGAGSCPARGAWDVPDRPSRAWIGFNGVSEVKVPA
jgi:hypothetical protein